MKINKQFVQEVANGKYKDYDSHGEMQRAAQRILDEKVVSKFQAFCFSVYGKEMPDHVMDVYDVFVDFAIHGAEIRLKSENNPERIHVFKGMTAKESLKKMFDWISDDISKAGSSYWGYKNEFTIAGDKRRFRMFYDLFHFCFAMGYMDEQRLLMLCRVA